MGAKKRPFYRIVAADSRRARDGRFLENLGTYNPICKPAEVKVQEDKLTYWFDQGAQPSDTVKSLLTQIGFNEKYEKAKRGEDVSEIVLKTTIKERKKKTRKMKKAVAKAAEAEVAKKAAAEKEAADKAAADKAAAEKAAADKAAAEKAKADDAEKSAE
jgi:small subunit ribosomal protein S16